MLPIRLIVKAPNQKVEDQLYECEKDWTVYKLKQFISGIYPTKPTIEDQRLIYSGHLLKNNQTLREIFGSDERESYTVHLVCNVRNQDTNLIHRNNVPTEKTLNVENVNESPPNLTIANNYSSPFISNYPLNTDTMNRFSLEGFDSETIAQQCAIMQMLYAQYMAMYSVPNVQQLNDQVQAAGPANQVPEQPAINQRNQFEDEDDPNERDWLYWVFALSRMFFLLLVIYFYCSFVRLVVVSFAIVVMHLYHARMRNRPVQSAQEQRPRDPTQAEVRMSPLRHCWMILSALITSLLPYHTPPPPLNVN